MANSEGALNLALPNRKMGNQAKLISAENAVALETLRGKS